MTDGSLQWSSYGYAFPILAFVVVAMVLLVRKMQPQMDSREPPLLQSNIPVIGHLLGMLRYHMIYFKMLSVKQTWPAFTISTFGSKTYVVTDPALVQSALRAKTLSFEPFETEFAQRMLDIGGEAMKIIRKKPASEKEPYMMGSFHKAVHEGLAQGPALDRTNLRMLTRAMTSVNKIDGIFAPDSLYLWLRHLFSDATAAALFGRHNPFDANPSLIESLWDFETDILYILIGVLPSVIAPAAYRGRAALQSALIEYYTARYDEDPSVGGMIKKRAALYREYGFDDTNIGKLELSSIHVATTNAIPTLFWLFVYVFSNPHLVQEIRAEVLTTIVPSAPTQAPKARNTVLIDGGKFQTHCPLLVSAYNETMRLCNAQTGNRWVLEDTLISSGSGAEAQTYLLKKDSAVQLPAGIIHANESIWGSDVAKFNPRRFMSLNAPGARLSDEEKLRKKSFLPFGGGKHLCPGRWFAFAEVLGMIAVMTLGFEVSGGDGGPVSCPTEDIWQKLGEGVGKPIDKARSMGVRIKRRSDFEDVDFGFVFGEIRVDAESDEFAVSAKS